MTISERSPIYSHLSATMQGMSVIRAYKMEQAMIEEFERLQDIQTSVFFAQRCCSMGWIIFQVSPIISSFMAVSLLSAVILDITSGTL